ncbi:MAG TPA: translocation/assembly module TamB, partial [Lysobacter sp.]|nr:translocation/assembly module TamB [Lysobacter sp.]
AVVVLAWWLLTTVRGRDVLLAQIVARLPAGASLTWQSAEGPASGPLSLHGVRFSMPRQRDPDCKPTSTSSCAMGRITFSAREVVLDPALRPLLGRRLRLDALDVRGAVLDLPRSDKPFELPRWPESLPGIAPPLDLQADTIRIDAMEVRNEGEHLVRIDRARGGIDASNGRLHVEHLDVDSDRGRFAMHGDYAPRDHYRSDLIATAVLPSKAGQTAPRLGLVARGDLDRMDVALAGRAPAPLRATLVLRGGEAPNWSLRVRSEALDPALLMGAPAGTPLAFDLRADGVGGRARLQGNLTRDALQVVIQPSQVTLREQVLDVAPLVLDTFDGRVTLRGHADLRDPGTASLRFAVVARGMRWGGTDHATPAIVADADFGIAGKPDAWAAIGKATLLRDGERARLQLDGRGDRERMALRSLHVAMPTGALDATGEARWSPQLGWNFDASLAGFDPGYFFPAWPGRVDGRFATRGSMRAQGGLDAALDVPQLGGRLRGRALSGHGKFALHGGDIGGELALGLGNSRVDAKGRIGGANANNALAVDARFAPLHLDDLLPSAGGTLQGTLNLRGRRDAPDVAVDLTGNGLRWNEWRADALQAHGRLPWHGNGGALVLDARGLEAGVAFDTLHVDARGAVERLTLNADARSTLGNVALAGNATKRGSTWQGALASLQVAPVKGARWRLQQAANFRWDGRNGALSNACLASSGGGTLCANADWPRRGLGVRGNGLPLTLLTPYLPARTDGRPWLLRGEIAIDGQLRPAGNAWRGNVRVTSASGGLKNSERARSELVAYDALAIEARFDPQRINLTLGAGLNGDGRVDA